MEWEDLTYLHVTTCYVRSLVSRLLDSWPRLIIHCTDYESDLHLASGHPWRFLSSKSIMFNGYILFSSDFPHNIGDDWLYQARSVPGL